jgi:two-component system, cell cycle sensor histidine kinase and response regulator CckA
VVLIEDNPGDARLLQETVRAFGDELRIEHFGSLGESQSTIEAGEADVVLLDLTLPDASGLATVRSVLAMRPDQPVVVLTGTDNPEVALRAVQAGAHDYLVKGTADGPLLLRVMRYAIERAETSRTLQRAQRRYEAAVRGSDDAIWESDLRTGKTYRSRRWSEMLGYPPDYNPSLPEMRELIHPDDREALIHQRDEHYAGNTQFLASEHRIRGADGRYRWIMVRAQATRDADGKPIRIAGSTTDITAPRAADEQSRLQTAALAAAANGIVITGADGNVIWANPAFEALTGYQLAEVVGKSTNILKSGEQGEEFYVEMWATIAAGNVWQGELTNRRKDGSTYPEEMMITPVPGADGEISHYVAIKQDITERRRAQEEMRQIQVQMSQSQRLESMGAMARGVAHDFNNMLMAMIGNADLALMDLTEDHPAHESVEQIHATALHASGLTNQMLSYAGKGRFTPESLDLNAVIRDMDQMLRAVLPKSTKLNFQLAEGLPPIKGDAGQMQQVVVNLVGNAGDAIGEVGGEVTVSTEAAEIDASFFAGTVVTETLPTGRYVAIEITDTGAGMTPEVVERAFEPFFTTRFIGRGLGLASVLGIVRGHDGAVRLESEPGLGTKVRVILPPQDRVESGEVTPPSELSG